MHVLTYYPAGMREQSIRSPSNNMDDVRRSGQYSSNEISRVEVPVLDARKVMDTRFSRYPVTRNVF